MYAIHAAKFAYKFRKYNRNFKPYFDRVLNRLVPRGETRLSDLPRYLAYTGGGLGSVGMAYAGMKRIRGSYASRKRAAMRAMGGAYKKRRVNIPNYSKPTASKKSRPLKQGSQFRRSYLKVKAALTRKRIAVRPKLVVPYKIDRWQAINPEIPVAGPGAFPGALQLGKARDVAGTGSYPMMIFDLTVHNNSTPVTDTQAGFRLGFTDAMVPVFTPVNSQNPNGTFSDSFWKTEDGRNLSSTVDFPQIQNAWYDVRMKLYGAKQQSTTFDIFVCRFTRAYMLPIGAGANVDEIAARSSFWQWWIRSSVVNSILPGPSSMGRYVKVLKHRRVNIPAASADDLDAVPNNVDVKMFVRDGRIRSYADAEVPQGTEAVFQSTAFQQQVNFDLSNRPHPLSQLFLVVRATDMSAVDLVTEDGVITPSFDVCIRRKAFLYR